MTDDRLERALSEAIGDLAGTGAPDYLDDILERTARARQRPAWTFPGRYLSMSSNLKFAIAASLAFILGLGLAPLIQPPSDESLGAPAATVSSPEPSAGQSIAPPVSFTGQWEAMRQLPSDVELRTDTYPTQQLSRLWSFRTVEMSDPRLEGDVVASNDMYTFPDVGVDLYSVVFRIDNEDGAWVEVPSLVMNLPRDQPTARTTVLIGDGAYEGLMAVVEIDWLSQASGLFDVRGIILEGDVGDIPPPPDPPSAPAS